MSKRVNNKRGKKSTRRYRPGRRTFKADARDAAVLFKGDTGQVRFIQPTDLESQTMGGPAFWLNFIRWMFENTPDGAERREVFVQEFTTDIEERQLRREAERRVDREPDSGDLDDECREKLILEAIDQIREESNAEEAAKTEAAD